MPYYDDLRTHRIAAGVKVSELAREASVHPDTVRRAEKHKNCAEENLVRMVNALNKLFYANEGNEIQYHFVITDVSRYGG